MLVHLSPETKQTKNETKGEDFKSNDKDVLCGLQVWTAQYLKFIQKVHKYAAATQIHVFTSILAGIKPLIQMSVFALPSKQKFSHPKSSWFTPVWILFVQHFCLQEKRNHHVFILYIHLYTDCIYTSTKHRKSCFSRSNDHTHRLLHDYGYEWSPAYGTVVDGSAVCQCQRTDTQHLLKDRQKKSSQDIGSTTLPKVQ